MEEMEVNHVDDIHEKLTDMVGDRVKVKANMGRTRVVERMGTIKSVHPAVFIVEVDERRGRKSRQSYQYIDVLTGQVELFDPERAHFYPARQSARGALAVTDWSLTLSAPAKINLYLGVHTERDDRGYHRVDSLMAAVSLSDTVTVTPAQALTVQTVPASDFPMQKNTAYRAAIAMAEHYGREANICVTIEKRIPLCAGLGGPSTDAAAVIVALAELWGIDRTDPALDDIARGIGADVPFFLHASPAFYVGGGDVLATEYPALPATPVVLVKPREASVSTIEAYRRFDEAPVPADEPGAIASALRAGDAETAYALIHNNLGVISAQMEPQIQTVLDWLRKQDGTVAVDVCGSGACSFAICGTAAMAERLADAAQQNGWWSCATELIPNTVQIDASKK